MLFPKEDFGNRSEVRNRLLADLLSRTIYMEKAGTGIRRVKDACRANDNIVNFDFTDAFWVTIHSNKENVTENVTEKNIIREILNNKNISTTELAGKFNVTRRTIARYINKLKEKGILERIVPDKGGYWKVIINNGVDS